MRIPTLPIILCLLTVIAHGQSQKSGPWEMQNSLTTASLRGIHSVGGGVAWASGTGGTVLRTEDSGYMWQTCAMPPGAEKLDFRGIWAWDADNAIVMSSGPGDQSRIYKTTDGCSHWTLLYTNPDKDGFWDALVFGFKGRPKSGLILGDPVKGSFQVLSVGADGSVGQFLPLAPIAANGAGAFAASNSSLTILQPMGYSTLPQLSHDTVLFGTGGKAGPILYRLRYRSIGWERYLPTWEDTPVPLAHGEGAGIFSIGFRDLDTGMAVGGDYTKPNESTGTAAWTTDGGKTWTAATKPPHGYRSTVAWDEAAKAWIAAGTSGSDISYDDGKTWQPLDSSPEGGNWNAISLPWIVGSKGRIAKLGTLPPQK